MLKLTLPMRGAQTTIELNGVDISRFFNGVEVKASVNGSPTATLSYRGAVVIEGEPGQIAFRHSEEEKEDVVINLTEFGVYASH